MATATCLKAHSTACRSSPLAAAGLAIRLAVLSLTLAMTPVPATVARAALAPAGSPPSLASLPGGTPKAWGWNNRGQLGTGNPSFSNIPLSVLHLTDVVAISAASDYALALRRDGTVWAWGMDQEGQLGRVLTSCPYPPHISSEPCSAVPVRVAGLDHIVAIAAGDQSALALRADGTVWAWGDIELLGQDYFPADPACGAWAGDLWCVARPRRIPGLRHVAAITVGSDRNVALALEADGTVRAWGDGDGNNNLGVVEPNNGEGGAWAPWRVAGLRGITAVATSGDTSFALRRDGTVWAWGRDDAGQRGDGRRVPVPDGLASYPPPTKVATLTHVVFISAGYGYSMAVTADGALWAWGSGWNLVGPEHDAPVPVHMPVAVATVATATADPTVALGRDGTVWTWGDNYWGQLGTGKSGGESMTPQRVYGLSHAVAIAAGFGFGLAIQAVHASPKQ